jgi:hypothetical protein
VDQDTSPLNAAARALSKFQSLYGVVPNIKVERWNSLGVTPSRIINVVVTV